MAWNEPGDHNKQDPWGRKRNDGPPDLDEALRKFMNRLSSLLGGGGGSRGSDSGAGTAGLTLVAVEIGRAHV